MAPESTVRPGTAHPSWAPEDEKALAERVDASMQAFEQSLQRDWHDRCTKYYSQYRSFSRWRNEWNTSGPNDKDDLLVDGKRVWGAHLHIPLSFRTIETQVPAAIAHRPRLLYQPRLERWAENVKTIRLLIDAQQDQISIDLPFQSVMRSGRIYGLGIGKVLWRKEYELRRVAKRKMWRPNQFYAGPLQAVCSFDDPDFIDVDVFDFAWDAYGSAFQGDGRCRWVIHRTWLGLNDCLTRIRGSGDYPAAWNTQSAKGLDEDKLRAMGGDRARYDEIWQQRMQASGFPSYSAAATMAGEQIHELLEWHDGVQVLSLLDRQVLVVRAENPAVGMLPFMGYRPVPLQKQLVGIGDLEPLEHLQRELDTLRSQRRDAATIALSAGFAFDDGAVDEDDLVFGPGAAIRVTNARPSDALFPLPARDVPGSGYQEEQVIRQDFDVVAGLSDALNPNSGTVQTATEAQLVQASLARRVELGARRFELEVVKPAAKAFLYLDQRMITAEREPVRQPDEGLDEVQAAQEGRWKWFPVGPAELRGEFEIAPEGGSMAARNIPQDRQDAGMFMQIFGSHPNVDPRRPLVKALELMGIKDPQAWLKQDAPPVPPLALEYLGRAGVDKRLIQDAVKRAQEASPQLGGDQGQQGPGVAQVDAAMQGNGNGGPPQ